MRILFCLCVCFLGCLNVKAQDTLFTTYNRVYYFGPNTAFMIAAILETRADGATVVATFSDSENKFLGLVDLNDEGEITGRIALDEDIEYHKAMASGSSLRKSQDGNYLLAYVKAGVLANQDPGSFCVMKFDRQGNVIWNYEYNTEEQDMAASLSEAPSGNILVSGVKSLNESDPDTIVILLDADGNEQWVKYFYGNNDLCGKAGNDVSTTSDGNFIVSGLTNMGYGCGIGTDRFAMKIDEDGEVLWDHHYSYPYYDSQARLLELNTGGFLMSSVCSTETGTAYGYFAYLDSQGEILYENPLLIPWISGPNLQMRKVEDGFVGVSMYNSTEFPLKPKGAQFFKISPDLQLQFTRPLLSMDYLNIAPKDFAPTPDGGYLVIGADYIFPYEYSWVTKIDSLGNHCPEADCYEVILGDVSTDLETSIENISFTLYPNPVPEIAQLQYVLPTEVPFIWLEIFDAKGMILRSKKLYTRENHAELDLSSLDTGLYIYRLRSGPDILKSGEFIK